ncbi:hypothetical protein ACFOOL_03375 [Devosia honganensis]|uniref:Uncharacterized protein n=1 Tax=Devosia honganensis TaxID=1610527 RepID=A0ABV7WWX5_9HYPH
MATARVLNIAPPRPRAGALDLRGAIVLLVAAFLPLGAFGLVNLGAEALGILPLFFAPFGLPGWMGAVAHLAQLCLLGAAFGLLPHERASRAARLWLLVLVGCYIALPFVTPPLDSLQLSLVCTTLFLVGLAALRRVGAAAPGAGWLMTPMLLVLGFSATMGLAIAAAYSPPFALMQGQQAPPA